MPAVPPVWWEGETESQRWQEVCKAEREELLDQDQEWEDTSYCDDFRDEYGEMWQDKHRANRDFQPSPWVGECEKVWQQDCQSDWESDWESDRKEEDEDEKEGEEEEEEESDEEEEEVEDDDDDEKEVEDVRGEKISPLESALYSKGDVQDCFYRHNHVLDRQIVVVNRGYLRIHKGERETKSAGEKGCDGGLREFESVYYDYGGREERDLKSKDDDMLLSYGTIFLRQRDINLLDEPNWLNDKIIQFYFAYVSSEKARNWGVLLMDPSTSFWLSHCPDRRDVSKVVDQFEFKRRAVVMFPVNNYDYIVDSAWEGGGGGGSHWSLLVYVREENQFHHFDSNCGVNYRHAAHLADATWRYLEASSRPQMIAKPTPQQTNGYDCGMYVIAIADVLCSLYHSVDNERSGKRMVLSSSRVAQEIERRVTASCIRQMRITVRELIQSRARRQ